jgi:hypothetical protein
MTGSDQSRQATENLFAAWERWDLDTVGSLVADNAVDERPQSGERFVGRSNIMGMYAEVPGPRGSAGRTLWAVHQFGWPRGSSSMAQERSISS